MYILEPSPESDLEELADSDLSDGEYLPDDRKCMNDANYETDKPGEGNTSDRETGIDLDIEKYNSKKLALRKYRWRNNEPLRMMTHLKASFLNHRQKQMDLLLRIITNVFGTTTSGNTLPTKSMCGANGNVDRNYYS